jgi:hypothetical protein
MGIGLVLAFEPTKRTERAGTYRASGLVLGATARLKPMHEVRGFERREERRAMKVAAANFIRAAETNDPYLAAASLEHGAACIGFWKQVLRQGCTVHPDLRPSFLRHWEESGDSLRSTLDDDLLLLDLLRLLLPPYVGPAVELFRGETAWNRRRRTYGQAWSASREAATCFAIHKPRRSSVGGSVLLRTVAPPDAIICAPHVLGARRPTEAEYIVDRRRLSGGVTVLERFSERPLNAMASRTQA